MYAQRVKAACVLYINGRPIDGKREKDMEELEGFIGSVIFHNAENGYTVFEMEAKSAVMTCVGNFPELHEGEYLLVRGEYIRHPVYGTQLKVQEFEPRVPTDLVSMEIYLSSGAVKGIGAKRATQIIEKFGEDAFRIMEEEPERLAEIKGISLKLAQEIAGQVFGRKHERNAIMYLQNYGISLSTALRIYREYQDAVYDVIQNNPYQLAENLEGIGFRTADEIALQVGIVRDSEFRIRSGVFYVLQQAAGEGHTYLPEEELTRRAAQMLQIEPERIREQYMNMLIEGKLVKKGEDQMYANVYYRMENSVAVMLDRLNLVYDVPDIEMEDTIRKIEKETTISLDERQVAAIKGAVTHGVFLLTGGPGTGKTTTINTMIRYFHRENMQVLLAAPTGRAAKRMSEMTGEEAKTIHRLLEFSGGGEASDATFGRNMDNPLDADVIIIDEMSMVDISLMCSLLKAILPGTRLVLVGDRNQLPSVGPGSVLKDMAEAGEYAGVALQHIFRQAAQSDIVLNAHKIQAGEPVALDNQSRDFFLLKRHDTTKVINVMLQLVVEKLPPYVNCTPFDIQVLTPTRKGELGVENLNRVLQNYINPAADDKREYEQADRIFREGDKVMQSKNNYRMEWEVRNRFGIPIEKGTGVFNGDMGVVKEINTFAGHMVIAFDEDHVVEYPLKQLEELEHAYAITVHKSQGSEYPAIVMPMLGGPTMLLNRNLLYTAVTRAKQCVVMVGDEKVFDRMAQNVTQQDRYSGLSDRIREIHVQELLRDVAFPKGE